MFREECGRTRELGQDQIVPSLECMLQSLDTVLIRVAVAMVKLHYQQQLGKEKVYLAYTLTAQSIIEKKSRQELKQGKEPRSRS